MALALGLDPRAWAPALADAARQALEQRRGFLLFPFAVMSGLLLYRAAGAEPDFWITAALVLVAAAWLAWIAWRGGNELLPFLCLGLCCGFALLPLHGLLNFTPMLAGSAYGGFSARVEALLDASSSGQRVIISDIVSQDGREVSIRRARLFVRDGAVLMPGDIVSARLRFYEVPGPALPGGYDAQFRCFFDGIGAYGTAMGAVAVTGRTETGLAGLIAAARQGIGARIDAVLDGRQAAVARALVIGDQSRIPEATRNDMATAGIAHVLAISGLHLTLVAGVAFAALRFGLGASHRLAQRVAIKKLAAAAGMVVVLVYLALSGASVSATRASVMLILVFGAMLFGRRALTMRNVAFAALFVLAAEPTGLFRPGFQLSFAAVAALIGTYEHVRRGERDPGGWGGRVWRFFVGIAVTSLVAGLATAVFAAYHFQQTAPLGLAGNLVALPVLGFLVLPSLALGVVAMSLGLEAPLLMLGGFGITQILDAASVIARASAGIEVRPLLSPWVLLHALGAAAWFVFFVGRLRLVGPALATVLILAFGQAPVPDVLIADTTQAVGVRDGTGLALMSGRAGSFVTDVWSETYGLEVGEGGDAIACDGIGCIATLPGGGVVALVKDMAGFFEDCDLAGLVVTRLAAPMLCRQATTVIDRDDLARGGVTAAYWQPTSGSFAVEPSILDPDRPWRIRRKD